MRRFIRDDEGVHFDHPSPSYEQKDFVPVEVKAGSLVVIHGDLIHQRLVNSCSLSSFRYSSACYLILDIFSVVLRTSHQTRGMLIVCMWWILMVANGQGIIGESLEFIEFICVFFPYNGASSFSLYPQQ